MDALKTLASTLYARVIVAYRSTLLGLAVITVSEVANALNANPSPYVRIAAAVVGVALVLLKQKQAEVATDPSAK